MREKPIGVTSRLTSMPGNMMGCLDLRLKSEANVQRMWSVMQTQSR